MNLLSQNQGYLKFVSMRRDVLKKTDLDEVREWVESRINAMPEMNISSVPLTGADSWKEIRTQDGKNIQKIDGDFFAVEGRKVTYREPYGTKIIEWSQPGIIQKQITITIPTPDGDISLFVSDIVGVIKDRSGNILLTVEQGIFAKTEMHAKVRTPIQTSARKAQYLLENNEHVQDSPFAESIEILGGGKSLFELFATGDFEIFPLGEADENRIDATNIAFITTVWDEEICQKLVADGKNRWCAPDEIKALARAGLINGHTAAALLVV